MKKDAIRDYATEAFRFYAAIGKPSCDLLRAKYRAEALESYKKVTEKGTGISKPTESALMYLEKELGKKEAELLDILAVEKVYNNAVDEVKEIIEIVYFDEPHKPLRKGDISARVCKASMHVYKAPSKVYAALKAIRIRFAEERGLRV